MYPSIPEHRSLGRFTPVRRRARERLVHALWDDCGRRRLVADRVLSAAVKACDPRDVWWVCEMSSYGPIYFLPTREWVRALSRLVDRTGARRVLEVGAGDGFLSRCLAWKRPDLVVLASDNGAWRHPAARMSKAETRSLRGVAVPGLALGSDVLRLSAQKAVRRHRPDLVIVSWAPPGPLVEQMIRAPTHFVLDIAVDGDVCGSGPRTWRFAHEPLTGAIVERALCRLDARPLRERKTRATLYVGAQ